MFRSSNSEHSSNIDLLLAAHKFSEMGVVSPLYRHGSKVFRFATLKV